MAKEKQKMEFRYYDIPKGDYVLAKLGKGWEQEYGLGMGRMLHFHNYLEIGFCYQGSGELVIEDRSYRYSDKMFTVIPENIPHTTISDPGHICKWEFLFINIKDFIQNEIKCDEISASEMLRIFNKRGTLKSMRNHPSLAKIILKIIEECREQPLYYKESIKGYIHALIIEVLRLDEEREKAKRSSKINTYIRDAIGYVGEHYQEDIKIADMAEVCGLSESHFRRIFEESMNMKPLDYVNMIRIDRACSLIQRGDMSMEDICYHVGYTTPSTFNRNFKRLTDKTPVEWKKTEVALEGGLANFHITAEKGWEGLET